MPSPGVYAWDVGALPPGARHTFHLVVRVGDLETTGSVLINTVTIAGLLHDGDPGNQQGQWLTDVVPGTHTLYLPLVFRAGP